MVPEDFISQFDMVSTYPKQERIRWLAGGFKTFSCDCLEHGKVCAKFWVSVRQGADSLDVV
jgi:hypothetical protein